MIKKIIRKILTDKHYDNLKKRKKAFIYKGSKFECPVCKCKLKTFLPGGLDIPIIREKDIIGAGFFEDVMCPVCGSYNRDRLFYMFLKRETDIFKNSCKLLHIAPEKAIQELLKKSKNVDYLSSDINSPLADIEMDITNIQFPRESFDIILCNHVLEHVPDDSKAISELYRVLKYNGWAILQVPISYNLEITYEDFSITDPKERELHFGQNDHVRIYGKDYFERLEKAGFIVESIPAQQFLDNTEISKFAVIERERIFFCRKIK